MGRGVRRKDLSIRAVPGRKMEERPSGQEFPRSFSENYGIHEPSRENVPDRTQEEQRPSGDMWWTPGLGHSRKFFPTFYNLEQVLNLVWD